MMHPEDQRMVAYHAVLGILLDLAVEKELVDLPTLRARFAHVAGSVPAMHPHGSATLDNLLAPLEHKRVTRSAAYVWLQVRSGQWWHWPQWWATPSLRKQHQ